MRPDDPRSSAPIFGGPPYTVPAQMPDRKEADETLLVGPRKEPLIVRRPRPLGFRPERAR